MRCRAPALVPVVALVAAVWIVRRSGTPALALALLPAVWLLPGRRGIALLAVVVGLCSGAARPSDEAWISGLDTERPVRLLGRPLEPWSRATEGWRTRLQVESWAQPPRHREVPGRLDLYLAGDAPPPAGATLRLRGYLKPAGAFRNTARRSRRPWRLVVSSPRLVEVARGPSLTGRSLGAVRRGVAGRLASCPAEARGISRALLLGDADELPFDVVSALRRVGLGHLLAVSGLHLGLVSGVTWLVSVRLSLRSRLSVLVLAVLTYLILVGPRPSLLRAAVMALLVLVSMLLERRPQALNAWALAVGSMVLTDIALIDEIGFQLTAAATLGLILCATRLRERWKPALGDPLAAALATSVAAHLATLPWSVGVFHLWSPISILLNLVAVPWTALTLALSALAALLGPLGLAGDAACGALQAGAAPYGWLAEVPPARLPASLVSRPFAALLILSVALGVALCHGGRVVTLVVLVAAVAYLGPWLDRPPAGPELALLDVGQGEALLLRDGSRSILVDGGGWNGPGIARSVLFPALAGLGVRRLDGVLSTHPDRDHCGGLAEIVRLLPVRRVYSASGWRQACQERLSTAPGVAWTPLWAGRVVRVGGWRLEVLHPAAGAERRGNESSMVVLAGSGRWRFLLTGDVGVETERRLLAGRGGAPCAEVLKVGHHGSRFSTGEAALAAIGPRLALISAGTSNPYGHPSPEVLERLGRHHVDVWRTDRGGLIRLRPSLSRLRLEQPFAPDGSRVVSYNAPDVAPCRDPGTDGHR